MKLNESWRDSPFSNIYTKLHPEVYIIIIPAFGVISHVIQHYSRKPIFGQNGPLFIKQSQQTICGNILNMLHILIYLYKKKRISKNYVDIKRDLFNVFFKEQSADNQSTISYFNWLIKSIIGLNFRKFESKFKLKGLCMLVGISETIRLLLIRLLIIISILKSNLRKYFIIFNYNLNKYTPFKFEYINAENPSFNIQYINVGDPNYQTLFINAKNPKLKSINGNNDDSKFNEWLAGLIDGDGCFLLNKKGYASLEITMEIRDKRCLYMIKDKFGGSIKLFRNNCLRYRLHHKTGLLNLINAVNGLIRNPIRLIQLAKIGDVYSLNIIPPKDLTYNNAWLTGFIDSDGSIYYNLSSIQLFITISQKNKLLLDPLVKLYGGNIYIQSKLGYFKWTVYKKDEIINLLNYFKINPLRSPKQIRISLIPDFYYLIKLGAHRASNNSLLKKLWIKFENKWNKYE